MREREREWSGVSSKGYDERRDRKRKEEERRKERRGEERRDSVKGERVIMNQ